MLGMRRRALMRFTTLLVVLAALSLAGCESDPLLSPQADDKEETGSYGRSNLRSAPLPANPEVF